jgi:TonB family protein
MQLGSLERAALAVVLLSCPAAQAQDLARALAQPLSPGSVALLTFHPGEPAVIARWTAALKDDRPEVRAAAARVIHASGASALVQPLLGALAVEQDPGAAREEILALAVLGGRAADDDLLKAAARFPDWGANFVASAVARARGGEAFQVLPRLGKGFEMNDIFLSWATRGGTEGLTPAASRAVRDGDVNAWEAVLKLVRGSGAAVDVGVIVAALGGHDALRAEAYFHLALVQSAQGKLDDRVKAVLNAPEGQQPADVAGRLTLELLQRTLGRKPAELVDWIDALGKQKRRAPYAKRLLSEWGLLRHLERRELEALSLAANGDPKALGDQLKRMRDTRVPSTSDSDPVGTVDGFPRGFVAAVLEASGCDPARAHGLALGEITFAADGRPMQTALTDPQTSARLGGPVECTEASRVLLGATLLGRFSLRKKHTMLVVLEKDVLGCLAEPPAEVSPRVTEADGQDDAGEGRTVTIKEPKKTRNVPPRYPENAKQNRIQGVVILEAVITPTGCVSSVDARRGVPGLNWEAIRAVMQWRYTPTLLNGVAVPVIMTITVNFKLQ